MAELVDIVHDNDFFRNGFINMIIIGKSGCGKSYLAKLLIGRLSSTMRTIIIATSVSGVPYHDQILKFFSSKGASIAKCFKPDHLMDQIESCRKNNIVSPEKPGLILFDDFTDINTLRGPCYNAMSFAATKLRNQGWHMIFITQDIGRLPIPVRNSSTAQVFFDSYSRSNIRLFFQDIVDRLPDPALKDLLIRFIRNQPYRYLMTRQYPFDLCVGKGLNYLKVSDEKNVEVPTLEGIMGELDVDTLDELDSKTKRLQIKAGNSSDQLD